VRGAEQSRKGDAVPDPFDYYRRIELGKELVSQYIAMRPGAAGQMYTIHWLPQDADEHESGVHRLEIFLEGRRTRIFFPEAELAKAPGMPGREEALKQRVDRFFAGL
jgi:hypothetical protein